MITLKSIVRHIKTIKRFAGDRRASTSIIMGISMLPVMGISGAAIDYSRALGTAQKLQAALDTATLAGAIIALRNREEQSQAVFSAALPQDQIAGAAAATFHTTDSPTLGSLYYGEATVTIPTAVMKVLGINSITIKRKAQAVFGTGDNSCILTLGGELDLDDETTTFNGSPNVNLSGCTIRSNKSIKCNGNETGAVKAIAAGNVTNCPNPTPDSGTVPDIYAATSSNIEKRCGSANGTVYWGSSNVPFGPNVITVARNGYNEIHICGTLKLTGTGALAGTSAATDTVIVVENGDISVEEDANLAATRTTFVLTGESMDGRLKFPWGNGHSAALAVSGSIGTSNPWAGLALYQDPRSSEVISSTWGPGATLTVDGINYMPRMDITLSGNAATGSSACSKLVSYAFRINGGVNLQQTASKCTDGKVVQFNVHPWLIK
jgi:Flp pilus assembly protein TadG